MEQKKSLHIQYLSQGTVETGGYRHELKLTTLLTGYIKQQGVETHFTTQRLNKHYRTPTEYLQLMYWFFKQSVADVNIVPLRGALPSMVRNLFTQRKTIVVLHSHVQPYSSAWLVWFYNMLLWVFKVFKPRHSCIVTVANYWKQEFEQAGVPAYSIHVVPNLFEVKQYQPYRTQDKKQQIHLGMMEPKTDLALVELASRLSAKGYSCYFSTVDPSKAKMEPTYRIVYFEEFVSYLKAMAESLYTIQFPSIHEGWSRIGHESVLVGTTLIGKPVGGLAELLDESGSLVAHSIDEIETLITGNIHPVVKSEFVEKYDESRAPTWMHDLVNFCIK